MFKKLLLILVCSTACVCSGIEVAEKHLADLQKQYQAGMADALEMMQAEAELIQTKAGLDIAVSEEEIARMIELREKIYRLTEARYKEGLCSYIKVYWAKIMFQQYSETFNSETIEQLHAEALRMIEQQTQNGCADALDNYAMQRFILENKLHLPETAKEERALLIQQMEQNFADAEQLAHARYQAGFLPYDKVCEIQEEHALFKFAIAMEENLATPTSVTEKNSKLRDIAGKNATRMIQRYEQLVKQGNASPFTLLHARLDYLYSKKIISQYQEKQ
ncbi:MAG: TolC family protein [Akkermansia sp.]|nr:TolC family protein [Akkermansia sp.]